MVGNGGFLTPKPSFPILGFSAAVRGKQIPKAKTITPENVFISNLLGAG